MIKTKDNCRMYTLKDSQRQFYERVGRPKPASLSTRTLSELPPVKRWAGLIGKSAPSWASPVIRNTFIGFSPNTQTFNVGVPPFFSPCIVVDPMFPLLAQAAIGFRFAQLALFAETARDIRRGVYAEGDMSWWGPRRDWRDIETWTLMPGRLKSLDSSERTHAIDDLVLLEGQMPRPVRMAMGRTGQQLASIVLGHEYGHILRGDTSGAPDTTHAAAAELTCTLSPNVVNAEGKCDVLGINLGITRPAEYGNRKTLHRLEAYVHAVDAAIALAMLLKILSPRTLWADLGRIESYPSPKDRLQTMLQVIDHEVRSVVATQEVLSKPTFDGSGEHQMLDRIDRGIRVEASAAMAILDTLSSKGYFG